MRGQDLTGRQFGELTVTKRLENDKNGASRWLCKCSCGEEYVVKGSLLTTGKRTRCPSKIHPKNYVFQDITGQKFGHLTALYPVKRNDKRGSVIWHCRCDCGQETEVSYNSMVHANQVSCGCQKEAHQQNLHQSLTHVAGTSVDMLKSKKIPSNNTTGCKGVYWIRGKYVAKIVFQKKQYILGKYEKIEEAAAARKAAEKVLFDGVAEHYQKWKTFAEKDPKWASDNPIRVDVSVENGELNVAIEPNLA